MTTGGDERSSLPRVSSTLRRRSFRARQQAKSDDPRVATANDDTFG
jgi:hypothetical protein